MLVYDVQGSVVLADPYVQSCFCKPVCSKPAFMFVCTHSVHMQTNRNMVAKTSPCLNGGSFGSCIVA